MVQDDSFVWLIFRLYTLLLISLRSFLFAVVLGRSEVVLVGSSSFEIVYVVFVGFKSFIRFSNVLAFFLKLLQVDSICFDKK